MSPDFTPHDDQIVRLIIFRNRFDIWKQGIARDYYHFTARSVHVIWRGTPAKKTAAHLCINLQL